MTVLVCDIIAKFVLGNRFLFGNRWKIYLDIGYNERFSTLTFLSNILIPSERWKRYMILNFVSDKEMKTNFNQA